MVAGEQDYSALAAQVYMGKIIERHSRAGNAQTDCNRHGRPRRLNIEIASENFSPEMAQLQVRSWLRNGRSR
jgi:hypothetical protein